MGVVKFPGAKSPEDILRDVIELGVDDFAMAGVKDGKLFFATANTDKAAILLMLETFRHHLISGELDE